MADSLLFDGIDDQRTYSAGNIAGNGALSVAAIIKPSGAFSAYDWVMLWNSNIAAGGFGYDTGVLKLFDGTNERSGPTLVTDEWWMIGFSRAAGTTTPRYHTYRYSTSTLAHGNFTGTTANLAACTSVRWALSPTELFVGNLLIGGVWDVDRGDTGWQALADGLAGWVAAAPDEGWRFDTTGTITPFSGVSTQTGSVGATLDTGDVPAGWSDTLGDHTMKGGSPGMYGDLRAEEWF